jgi:SAM-dependent methyltransferase
MSYSYRQKFLANRSKRNLKRLPCSFLLSPAETKVIEKPLCPVCGCFRWREIGAKTYRLSDRVSDYARVRYRVLFEVWRPGAEELQLSFQLCEECGFVGYAPRPTTAELNAKYEFLSKQGISPAVPDSPVEQKRALELYRMLARYLPKRRTSRVLDFGGADGQMMHHFVDAGCECYLVDYCEQAVAGVRKIGTTEREIPEGFTFDVIVCSHVIEHVADPVAALSALAERLSPDGVLYAEVPLEIWGRPPLHEEPVTHVNFFTPSSLSRLFHEAGLSPIKCRITASTQPEGIQKTIKAWGRRIQSDEWPVSSVAVRETERLLAPDIWLRLKWRLLAPSTMVAAIQYKLGLTSLCRKEI